MGGVAIVNQGGRDAMSNCAMCTIAAIAGTDSAVIAQVLHVNGQSDEHLAAGLRVGGDGQAQQQGVLNNMIHLIEALMLHKGQPVKGYQYGFPGGERQGYKNLGQIRAYMQTKAVGTSFAIWGYQTNEIEGFGAHWNYATTVGALKRVEFRDYQDNTAGTTPAAVSDAFIAPSDARDESGAYNSFIVLSFEPR
jgi:hypothetical protein